MYFKDVIGHGPIIENLISTVKTKKVSHAYIFDGIDGVGKKLLAKVFASAILCDSFDRELCGNCKSCHLTLNGSHPDLKVVDMTIGDDGKQKASISVESVRQFKKDVYLKPFFSDKKIYILENAEKMTVEAQNAMLKIFEEPPSYVTIILICNGVSNILSTIKSRAVTYKFPPLKPKELENFLDKYYNEKGNKEIYSRISDGSISRMLELIDDEESLNYRKSIIDSLLILMRNNDETSVNSLFGVFIKNKDDRFRIISLIAGFIMDIVYLKTGHKDKITNIDYIDELEKTGDRMTLDNVFKMEEIIADLSGKLARNSNYKLAVINALIKLREEIYG